MRNQNISRWLIAGLTVGALLTVSHSAQAQSPNQFASFTQASVQNTPFRFINTGSSTSVFGLYNADGSEVTTVVNGNTLTGLRVNFQYQGGNALNAAPNTNIDAILRFTSSVNGTTASGTIGGTTLLAQNFQTVRMEFRVLNANGTLGGNLLTVTATQSLQPINGTAAQGNNNPNTNGSLGTTASLTGTQGSNTPSFSASESSTGQNYIGYTSDFLNFDQTFVNRNFNLSFTNATPTLARGSNPSGQPDSVDYFRSFTASGSGTFGSDPSPLIPEPTSVGLVLFGLGGIGLARRRK